jgi:TPR repeat protein
MAAAFYHGKKNPQDFDKALLLARESSSKLSKYGQLVMGFLTENGLAGVPQDDTKAFEWFQLAADQNEPEALNLLGSCYFNGDGVQRDLLKAFECYERAANLKHSDALVNLGRMYQYHLGMPIADPYDMSIKRRNLEKAMACFNEAANLDDPRGCLYAAIAHQEGLVDGIPQAARAWQLLLKGVALGDVMCMINVAKIYDTGLNQNMCDGTKHPLIHQNYRCYFVTNSTYHQ